MSYRPPFARMRQIKAQAAETKMAAAPPSAPAAPPSAPEPDPDPAPAPEPEASLDTAVEFSTVMKKADLLSAAAQMGVQADESMTKAEIVAALKAAQAG